MAEQKFYSVYKRTFGTNDHSDNNYCENEMGKNNYKNTPCFKSNLILPFKYRKFDTKHFSVFSV